MFVESNVVFAYLKVYLAKLFCCFLFSLEVFSLLTLSRTFKIATIRNDMFFVHGLFIFLISVSGKAQCLMLLHTVAISHFY